MRYAIVGDLHGRVDHLRLIQDDAAARGARELVALGDVLEVRVPKGAAAIPARPGAEAVVDADPALVALLHPARAVRGNQEERLLDLLPGDRLPPDLCGLRDLPSRLWRGEACCEHGHRFGWRHDIEPGVGCPDAAEVTGRVAFFGHNHQNVACRVPAASLTGARERLPVFAGVPVPVAGPDRFLFNVASLHRPVWALYDQEAATVTYYCPAAGGAPGAEVGP